MVTAADAPIALRVVLHDAATYDVATGKGGLNGSIIKRYLPLLAVTSRSYIWTVKKRLHTFAYILWVIVSSRAEYVLQPAVGQIWACTQLMPTQDVQ